MTVLVVVVTVTVSVLGAFSAQRNWRHRNRVRSIQREARTYLRGAMAGQRALFTEQHRYSNDFSTIGFSPEPGSRVTYVLSRSSGGVMPSTRTTPLTHRLPRRFSGDVDVGVFGHCADQCEVVIAAIGEADGELVIGSVASFPRIDARTGKTISAEEIVFEPK